VDDDAVIGFLAQPGLSRAPAPSLATASPTPMHVAIGLKTGAGCQQFVVFKRGGCRPMSCQASPDRASRAEVDREHQHRAACSCPLSCGRSASQQFHVELRDSNPDPHTASGLFDYLPLFADA
jgi:hypothetical protein